MQALTGRATPATARLASDISGNARFDLMLPEGTRPVRGSYAVSLDHVRIAGYEARNVVANGRLEGTTVRLNARGNAYGGYATAAGVVKASAPVALDLRGRASGVDLRNLPTIVNVPKVTSDLQFVR